MNRRLLPIYLVIFTLAFTGLLTFQSALLALALPFLVYLIAGALFVPRPPRLTAERTLSADRVGPGVPLQVSLKISNAGAPIESLLIEDLIPPGAEILQGSARKMTSLNSEESVQLNYTLQAPRGAYRLTGYHTIAGDHLGITLHRQIHPLRSRFLVLPKTFRLPEIAIRPRRTRVFPGLIPAKKGGPGVEFFGVREYQNGDPLRWINDRASARHDQAVFVNEFEQDRAVDVGLILDCRLETNRFQTATDLLEAGIQAAATLTESFLLQGNRVGLLIYGGDRNWVHPGYGKLQRERILSALAGVQLYENYVTQELTHLPARLFPARSQLVLVSSLQLDDLPVLTALRAHGYRLLIISPDPIDFERKLLGDSPGVDLAVRVARLERIHLLRQLRRIGARVFEWQVDRPFYQAAQWALRQRQPWGLNTGVVRA